MKKPILSCVLLSSLLVLMGCPASTQKKTSLVNPANPLPALRFEQDLDRLMHSHGRGVMFRVQMGPWKQFTNALGAAYKHSVLGSYVKPYGDVLTTKGPLHALYKLNNTTLTPKDEALFDFKRPAWFKFARLASPTVSELIDNHFLLLLPEDTPGGALFTMMLPVHDPKKAIAHLAQFPKWFGYDRQRITFIPGNRHVLMEINTSYSTSPDVATTTLWRNHRVSEPVMTPALAHWYGYTKSPLAIHFSTDTLVQWGLLGSAQEGTAALASASPSLVAQLLLQVVELTTQMAHMMPDQLQSFEDHTMVLQTNKTRDIVVDWHATRSAAGRQQVARWFGQPVMLPSFSQEILKDRENILVHLEGAMNLGAMASNNKNLANLGLSKLKGDDFLRALRVLGPIYMFMSALHSPHFGFVNSLTANLRRAFNMPLPIAMRLLVVPRRGKDLGMYLTMRFDLPASDMKKISNAFTRIPLLKDIEVQHQPGQGILVEAVYGSASMPTQVWAKPSALRPGTLRAEIYPKPLIELVQSNFSNFWRLPHRVMLEHKPNANMHTVRIALSEQRQISVRPLNYDYTPRVPKTGCGDMLVVSQRQFVDSVFRLVRMVSNAELEARLRAIDEQMSELDKRIDVCALDAKTSLASKARARAIAGGYVASLPLPPSTEEERKRFERKRELLGGRTPLVQNELTAKYGNAWLQYACRAKIKRACNTRIVLSKPAPKTAPKPQSPAPTLQPSK